MKVEDYNAEIEKIYGKNSSLAMSIKNSTIDAKPEESPDKVENEGSKEDPTSPDKGDEGEEA